MGQIYDGRISEHSTLFKMMTIKFLINHDILFLYFKEERNSASTDPVNTDRESKDDATKESDSSAEETLEKRTGKHPFLS